MRPLAERIAMKRLVYEPQPASVGEPDDIEMLLHIQRLERIVAGSKGLGCSADVQSELEALREEIGR